MFDIDKINEIWHTISKNKLRSFLTCFGVFWGILMLVILLGAGVGVKNNIDKQFEGFATNSVFLFTQPTSIAYKGYQKGRMWNMNVRDLEPINAKVKGIKNISPMIWGNSIGKNIVYDDLATSASVRGIYPSFFEMEAQHLLYGRLFNDLDIKEHRKVCILGKKVYETLFKKDQNPIGEYIRANGIYYQIIGVINPIPNVSVGGSSAYSVQLPFTTMQQTNGQGDAIHFLGLNIEEGYNTKEVTEQAKDILKSIHHIAPEDNRSIISFDTSESFGIMNLVTFGISALIWLVGLGTLLAGVIGISNIMMVTVRERTGEIGIRRALGAKPINIISQIMTESLFLTLSSGIIGLSFGVWILALVDKIFEAAPQDNSILINPIIPFQVAIIALIILIVSGLAAGLIPAWRAMQIKAIDAIREE